MKKSRFTFEVLDVYNEHEYKVNKRYGSKNNENKEIPEDLEPVDFPLHVEDLAVLN